MRIVYVNLPTIEAVHKFVMAISPLEGSFDLHSGRYIIDAKSLMGIFNLDLSQPIELHVEKDTDETMLVLSRFISERIPALSRVK